jgi:hypothetical protein
MDVGYLLLSANSRVEICQYLLGQHRAEAKIGYADHKMDPADGAPAFLLPP